MNRKLIAPAARCACDRGSAVVKMPRVLEWICLTCALEQWRLLALTLRERVATPGPGSEWPACEFRR